MRQLDIMAHMKKTATTYEIILKKVEHFRVAVKARSEEEAVFFHALYGSPTTGH